MFGSQFERRRYRTFGLLGIITVLSASVTVWAVIRFRQDAKRVEHSHEVLNSLAGVYTSTVQAGSSVRGFFASRTESELSEFDRMRTQAAAKLKQLRTLVSDNPEQVRRSDALLSAVTDRLNYLDFVSKLLKSGESPQDIQARHGDEGRRLIARVETATAEMRNEEQRLLALRQQQRESMAFFVLGLTIGGAIITIGLLIVGFRAIREYQEAHDMARQELRDANAGLERRVRDRTAELSGIAAALRRSNTDLEEFAYAASHDLQEPLRTISTFARILERRAGHSLDAECASYLQFIINGSGRLQELIHGLLEYSRVSRAPAGIDGRADLNEVFANVQKHLAAQIAESSAELSCSNLPVLAGDPLLLERVLQNLVGNSLKYRSPDRNPRIHVGGEQSDGKWVISVRDNGIGFDPLYKDQIFGIFKRLDPGYPGAGVGLAICQSIVENHGGRIWAQGELGLGATFYFTWPNSGTG